MKQLLFLLLFPCLALAQYQGNGNQKITLGEQTTADGLVFRGVASIDTVTATSKITRANKQDTSAYILLDTITNLLWHYKIGSNAWTQAGGSTFDTTTLNLVSRFAAKQNNITLTTTGTSGAATLTGATLNIPQYSGGITDGDKGDIDVTNSGATWTIDTSAVSLSGNKVTGTLPVANGGTNTGTLTANKVMVGNGTGGVLTPTNLHWDNTNSRLGIGTASPGYKLDISGGNLRMSNNTSIIFLTSEGANASAFTMTSSNNMSIGQSNANFAALNLFGGTGNTNIYAGSASVATFNTSGNVGIGTTSPVVQFHTTGGVRFATFAGGGTTTLSVDNNGDLARTSSFELKKDVTPINYGLNEILEINPINFNWIDGDKFGNENENGFIAEDVMSIIPNVVGSDAHGLFMDYTKLIPILTKAIQEQQALIKALEQRILILENK